MLRLGVKHGLETRKLKAILHSPNSRCLRCSKSTSSLALPPADQDVRITSLYKSSSRIHGDVRVLQVPMMLRFMCMLGQRNKDENSSGWIWMARWRLTGIKRCLSAAEMRGCWFWAAVRAACVWIECFGDLIWEL